MNPPLRPDIPPPSLDAWRAAGASFAFRGYPIFFRDSAAEDASARERPALLLLHGFPTASWDWHAVWPLLAPHYRLVAPDWIGFGFSAKPAPYRYALTDQADLVAALAEHLALREAEVLAHDYAVSVVQELLARQDEWMQPLRVRSVAFLNGGLFPESHRPRVVQRLLAVPGLGVLLAAAMTEASFAKSFAAVFGPGTQPSPAELRAFWTLLAADGGCRRLPQLIGYMAERRRNRQRWVQALIETDVPLCLVNGPVDPVSGAHLAARYRELVPNARVTSLPGIGHYPQVEDPAGVAQALRAFHAQIGAGIGAPARAAEAGA